MSESSLKGKNILLGVTGSVACYKAVDLASRFVKAGAAVQVLMTPTAVEFVRPLQFESITQRGVYHEMTQSPVSWEMEHIEFARWGEVLLIAPATATTLGRMAGGLAGDAVSSTYLAYQGATFIAPAMNHAMWSNGATQENVRLLQERGVRLIMPEAGRLACGDVGVGRLSDLDNIVKEIEFFFAPTERLDGRRIVITSGPTHEYIDPARFISNPSTGKMGHALAIEAASMGADVTIISGPVTGSIPQVGTVHRVTSAQDMLDCTMKEAAVADVIIFAAAVSDYRPSEPSDVKIKRGSIDELNIAFIQNPDIAATLGGNKREGQFFVGFAAETNNIEVEAHRKMKEKNLDMIVANPIGESGAGFGSNTNQGMLITATGECVEIPRMSKREMARFVLNRVANSISL
jgi:phosphopantothenoylcysteine decarboxylase/phosphopantothenate--cysteine ligase